MPLRGWIWRSVPHSQVGPLSIFVTVRIRSGSETSSTRSDGNVMDQTDVCNESFMPRRVKDSSFAV